MTVDAEELRDLDSERVLVLTRYAGRAKTSGLELGRIGAAGASLFFVRNGRVVRIVQYFDRARALTDFGLTADAHAAAGERIDELGG